MMLAHAVRSYGMLQRALVVPAFVFGVAIVGGTPGEAAARQVVTSFSTVGGPGGAGGFQPPVTTRDLDRYAQVLGLNEEQKSTAKSMIEGIVTDSNVAAKDARAAMADIASYTCTPWWYSHWKTSNRARM